MQLKPCGGVRARRPCVLQEGKQHSVLQRPVERDLPKVPVERTSLTCFLCTACSFLERSIEQELRMWTCVGCRERAVCVGFWSG